MIYFISDFSLFGVGDVMMLSIEFIFGRIFRRFWYMDWFLILISKDIVLVLVLVSKVNRDRIWEVVEGSLVLCEISGFYFFFVFV